MCSTFVFIVKGNSKMSEKRFKELINLFGMKGFCPYHGEFAIDAETEYKKRKEGCRERPQCPECINNERKL